MNTANFLCRKLRRYQKGLTANTLMVSLLLLVLFVSMCGVMQLDIARVLIIEVAKCPCAPSGASSSLFVQDHHYCESGSAGGNILHLFYCDTRLMLPIARLSFL